MAYTDATTIANALGRDLTTKESALVTGLIASASNYIDKFTGAYFDTVTETTRRYDGGWQDITIDPCHSITKVEIKDSSGTSIEVLDSSYYIAYPINEPVKTSLALINGVFIKGKGNVYVTGKYTYYISKVPEDINMVATELVISALNDSAGIASESIEGYSITFDKARQESGIIRSILDYYRNVIVG